MALWCFVPVFALLPGPASQGRMKGQTARRCKRRNCLTKAAAVLIPARLPVPTAQPSAFQSWAVSVKPKGKKPRWTEYKI